MRQLTWSTGWEGNVHALAFLIELQALNGREKLGERVRPQRAEILEFDGARRIGNYCSGCDRVGCLSG